MLGTVENLDSPIQSALGKIYQGAATYLDVLADTNAGAMAIIDAHDAFCRGVLQDEGVEKLFSSFGNVAGMLSSKDPSIMEGYEWLVRNRMALICTVQPHRSVAEVEMYVGYIRSMVDVLGKSQLPQIEKLVHG